MGVAAYNRGSSVISQQVSRDYQARDPAFDMMDRMNAVPKVRDFIGRIAKLPKGKALIQHSRGVWWLMDPDHPYDGWSWYYPTLPDLMSQWDIALCGYNADTGIWEAANN